MQKTKTKKVKRAKVIGPRVGSKKQRSVDGNITNSKPPKQYIQKSSTLSKSDRLTVLYSSSDLKRLNQVFQSNRLKMDIDNVFWVMMNNKNKKFLSSLFNRYGTELTVQQLGLLRDNSNISLRMIMDQARRRMR